MFDWLKTPKNKPPAKNTNNPTARPAPQSSRDKLIAEAMANARTARAAIGEETLDKVRDKIMQMQQQKQQQARTQQARTVQPRNDPSSPSPMDQARKILQQMDSARLADNLRALRDEDKK